MFKKNKIKCYLQNKQSAESLTAFDNLLQDYIQSNLIKKINEIGISNVKIYVDWLPEYKCINITGFYRQFIVEIQIEPLEYTIAYDLDEPDEYIAYPLKNAELFYLEVESIIDKF